MIFENLGRKFAKGARAEILEPKDEEFNWRVLADGIAALVKVGALVFAFVSTGSQTTVSQPSTIIINNYIQ